MFSQWQKQAVRHADAENMWACVDSHRDMKEWLTRRGRPLSPLQSWQTVHTSHICPLVTSKMMMRSKHSVLFAAVSLKLVWSHSYSPSLTISILNEKIFHFGGKWFEVISSSYKSNRVLFIYKAQCHTSRFPSRSFLGYRNIGRFHVILLIQLQNNWVSVLKWFSCTHIYFFSSVFHLEWSFGCGAASRAEKRGWQINGRNHDDMWL